MGHLSVEWSKAFASSCGQQALTPHLGDRCLQTSNTNSHLSGDPWFVTLGQLLSGSLPWWWIYPASASLLMLLPGNPLLGVHSYILLPASSTGPVITRAHGSSWRIQSPVILNNQKKEARWAWWIVLGSHFPTFENENLLLKTNFKKLQLKNVVRLLISLGF